LAETDCKKKEGKGLKVAKNEESAGGKRKKRS